MNGDNDIPLEEIFELLQDFGRPTANQYAMSASPGDRAAGQWAVEVNVPPISWEDAGKPVWWGERGGGVPDQPDGFSVVGWRCWGRGLTIKSAALDCLEKCMALKEGPCGPYAKFITLADIRAKERERFK